MFLIELQYQIDSDSARWIRHTLRGAKTSANSGSPSSPTKPIGHLPAKINQLYAEIEQLSIDKLALAERVVGLITRTCTRLDVDLNRARVLQGEIPSEVTRGRSVSASPSVTGATGTSSVSLPAASIGDSLRQALIPSVSAESRQSVVNTPTPAPPPKST